MSGVMALHEIFHETKRKKQIEVILKLDLEKAYDKVNWDFEKAYDKVNWEENVK